MTVEQTALSSADFDEFVNWYASRRLRTKGRPASPATLLSKRLRVASAARVGGCNTPEKLAALLSTREGLEGLLDRLLAGRTSGTVRSTVYALQDFGEWAKAKGLIEGTVLVQGDLPPENPKKPITVYTEAEVELLVNSARGRGLRWWAFLTFLADSGRRVGEGLSLHWSWFHLDGETPYIELPYTKNGRQQLIPLGRRLREDVFTPENIAELKLPENRNMEHCRRSPAEHPFPWQYTVAWQRFGRYCRAVGVEPRGFHTFRHTKATNLFAAGAPIQAVSSLLGHSAVATTDRIYNHATALSYQEWNE